MDRLMPQKCPLPMLYIGWILYLGGAGYLIFRSEPLTAAAWVIGFPVFTWAYLEVFPDVSHLMGYGRVEDEPADTSATRSAASDSVRVTLYTSIGCPFCPIMARRLERLGAEMGFELEEVDVTTRPGLVARKRIGAVPVVEVDGRRLTGAATSRELAELISGEAREGSSAEQTLTTA